jgi:hypothetical protein
MKNDPKMPLAPISATCTWHQISNTEPISNAILSPFFPLGDGDMCDTDSYCIPFG